MKPVLGKTIVGRKVVSNSGLELGYVVDVSFELGGALTSVLVKPEHANKEIAEALNHEGFLDVPYSDVKAVGRYVVVNFPSGSK